MYKSFTLICTFSLQTIMWMICEFFISLNEFFFMDKKSDSIKSYPMADATSIVSHVRIRIVLVP